MSARVVVVGSLNVDATCYVDDFPAPGQTIAATGFQLALGGKGANQAVAAHVAGADVALLARVGDDANGALALATLERLGLPTAGIRTTTDAPTGVALITVAASGENTVVVAGGANLGWTIEAVDARRAHLADAAVVLTQGELPVVAIERCAALAHEVGARFVLNLAPPVGVGAATVALADPLVVNEHEAKALGIGRDLAADAALGRWLEAAVDAVAAGTARSVVVTLGAAGAVAAGGAGTHDASARPGIAVSAPRVRAVDTTGAGDGFTGTLAAFLAEGRSLHESVRLAVAAASLAVQRRGTVDSYASRDRVIEASAALTIESSDA
ncbi:ribokinase [Agromyces sp. CFH 90414]|uniref:Ribokinase n=1 Tax=Agromyces agglutinans TaxID=2662258 RepID=A0A6I2FA22_9MICO|nr:ribokinase [Agromyces agglutinans]MRG59206.1 ribokinase [Agromyces agglutinans]